MVDAGLSAILKQDPRGVLEVPRGRGLHGNIDCLH